MTGHCTLTGILGWFPFLLLNTSPVDALIAPLHKGWERGTEEARIPWKATSVGGITWLKPGKSGIELSQAPVSYRGFRESMSSDVTQH